MPHLLLGHVDGRHGAPVDRVLEGAVDDVVEEAGHFLLRSLGAPADVQPPGVPGLLVAGPREAGHQLRRPRAHSLTLTLKDEVSLCAWEKGGRAAEGGGERTRGPRVGQPYCTAVSFCIFFYGTRGVAKGIEGFTETEEPPARFRSW